MNDMEILKRAWELEPWECAWGAAFLEGEGTFTICVSPPSAKCRSLSPRFTLWVKADNTEPELIYRLQTFFGGAVRRYLSRKGRKPAYRWLVTGPTAVSCLRAVGPYLASNRRKQLADLLLDLDRRLREFPKGGVRLTDDEITARQSIVSEVRILNNRQRSRGNWRKALAARANAGSRLPGI